LLILLFFYQSGRFEEGEGERKKRSQAHSCAFDHECYNAKKKKKLISQKYQATHKNPCNHILIVHK